MLITQANDFMGPATVDVFQREGASIMASTDPLTDKQSCDELVASSGEIDILIANLASPNYSGTVVTALTEAEWTTPFDMMVHPLHWLTQAVLPQMLERGRGKIVVYGSATALRGLKTVAAYSAARAAQVGYVQSVGVEIAPCLLYTSPSPRDRG